MLYKCFECSYLDISITPIATHVKNFKLKCNVSRYKFWNEKVNVRSLKMAKQIEKDFFLLEFLCGIINEFPELAQENRKIV
jgi:hypothetical protein